MNLWRPVGLAEMGLIFDSEMRSFPPRLPEQPIFYPVLNEDYAVQIARDWNTKTSPFAGFVLQFEIPDDYGLQFEQRTVGSAHHRELWVPAETLADFNHRIVKPISAVSAFFGAAFRGYVSDKFGLKGKDAYDQIRVMAATFEYSLFDFTMEIAANAKTMFLNYPFWSHAGAERLGIGVELLERCLAAMRKAWAFHPRPAPLLDVAEVTG